MFSRAYLDVKSQRDYLQLLLSKKVTLIHCFLKYQDYQIYQNLKLCFNLYHIVYILTENFGLFDFNSLLLTIKS